jgi:hypothetical protein
MLASTRASATRASTQPILLDSKEKKRKQKEMINYIFVFFWIKETRKDDENVGKARRKEEGKKLRNARENTALCPGLPALSSFTLHHND